MKKKLKNLFKKYSKYVERFLLLVTLVALVFVGLQALLVITIYGLATALILFLREN